MNTQLSRFPEGFDERLITTSPAMRDVLREIDVAAERAVHVLLSGEPGTGRETIARTIHARSKSSGPFIAVDCARHSAQDLEARLFATPGGGNRPGGERRSLERVRPSSHLYQSKGGTLFLQNVVDLPGRIQMRLARVLRDGEVVVVEESTSVELAHRVITAGDASLDAAVHDGRMIPDLHKRLSAFRVDVPALRDRRDDIPELASHIVSLVCARGNQPCKELSDAAKSMLAALPWHGNGKELRRLLEVLVMRTAAHTIGLDDVLANVRLDGHASSSAVGESLREARARFESEYISAVLAQHQWRVPEAAKTLGIQRSNLYRKMRHLKVRPVAIGKRPPSPK